MPKKKSKKSKKPDMSCMKRMMMKGMSKEDAKMAC